MPNFSNKKIKYKKFKEFMSQRFIQKKLSSIYVWTI